MTEQELRRVMETLGRYQEGGALRRDQRTVTVGGPLDEQWVEYRREDGHFVNEGRWRWLGEQIGDFHFDYGRDGTMRITREPERRATLWSDEELYQIPVPAENEDLNPEEMLESQQKIDDFLSEFAVRSENNT